jgi:hypothetical protein
MGREQVVWGREQVVMGGHAFHRDKSRAEAPRLQMLATATLSIEANFHLLLLRLLRAAHGAVSAKAKGLLLLHC